MAKITLEQFCNQWTSSAGTPIVSRFEKNIFDFTTIIGNRSKMFFQTSFNSGGFYGSGTRWAPRESKWGKKFTHPVLNDTGTLKNSIKGEVSKTSRGKSRRSNQGVYSRGAMYKIWSMPESKAIKGRRGKLSNRKKPGWYAAIHNSDPRLTNYTVNQYSSKKPTQRQFIGFSMRLDQDIERFYHILFRGFPND